MLFFERVCRLLAPTINKASHGYLYKPSYLSGAKRDSSTLTSNTGCLGCHPAISRQTGRERRTLDYQRGVVMEGEPLMAFGLNLPPCQVPSLSICYTAEMHAVTQYLQTQQERRKTRTQSLVLISWLQGAKWFICRLSKHN